MNTSSPPERLYKYQSMTMESLTNLKNREIWFSAPATFNDPFDCAIRVDSEDISEDELLTLQRKYGDEMRKIPNFEAEHTAGERPTARFAEEVERALAAVFKDRLRTVLSARGVACFSETRDNLLMWSHYACGHRGFCLEFDARKPPFPKAFRVIYTQDVPSMSPASLLLGVTDKIVMSMVTIKAACWAYEKEWRIFHMEPNRPYGVGVEALTGVYLGAAMDRTHKDIIAHTLHGSPTKLYEMVRPDRRFTLECRALAYRPFRYEKPGLDA